MRMVHPGHHFLDMRQTRRVCDNHAQYADATDGGVHNEVVVALDVGRSTITGIADAKQDDVQDEEHALVDVGEDLSTTNQMCEEKQWTAIGEVGGYVKSPIAHICMPRNASCLCDGWKLMRNMLPGGSW